MHITHHKALMDDNPAPPNSVEAVQNSLKAHADWIEIDIHALAADDYVINHDDTWEAGTVPLLSEIISIAANYPNTQLQLDLKNYYPFPDDEPLERLLKLITPIQERVVITSPADWQLRRLRYLDSSVRVGFDPLLYFDWHAPGWKHDPSRPPYTQGAYGFYDDHLLAKASIFPPLAYVRDRCETLTHQVPGVDGLYVNFHTLIHTLQIGFDWAEMLHATGIKLTAWTVDVGNADAESAVKQLTHIDNIITNTPKALRQLLS